MPGSPAKHRQTVPTVAAGGRGRDPAMVPVHADALTTHDRRAVIQGDLFLVFLFDIHTCMYEYGLRGPENRLAVESERKPCLS